MARCMTHFSIILYHKVSTRLDKISTGRTYTRVQEEAFCPLPPLVDFESRFEHLLANPTILLLSKQETSDKSWL